MTQLTQYQKEESYFEYLASFVGNKLGPYSMERLLRFLYNRPFVCSDEFDKNRADDGIHMRYRFLYDTELSGETYDQTPPANMLETMVALAIRIESIMYEYEMGDRTHSWFWGMVASLGLNGLFDEEFEEERAKYIMDRFDKKEYDKDGHGSLFWIRNFDGDMRTLEIWDQANKYISALS